MSTVNRIVRDEEIALRTSLYTLLAYTAFHTDTIVTSAHMTAGDESNLYVTRIHRVAVLCPPRTIDGDVLNNEVLDTCRNEVELRTVA